MTANLGKIPQFCPSHHLQSLLESIVQLRLYYTSPPMEMQELSRCIAKA